MKNTGSRCGIFLFMNVRSKRQKDGQTMGSLAAQAAVHSAFLGPEDADASVSHFFACIAQPCYAVAP